MAKNFEKEFRKIDTLVHNATLSVTQEHVEEKRAWLINFYKEHLYEGKTEEKVDKILEKAVIGWPKAPEDFDLRVDALVGYRTISSAYLRKEQINDMRVKGYSDDEIRSYFKNPKKNKKFKKLAEEVRKKKLAMAFSPVVDGVPMISNSVVEYLNEDEQFFWRKREVEYRQEFEFNNSSDKVLLDEVLYNEVLLRRIKIVNLTGENKETIKNLREVDLLQNHQRLLEKLGVLRVQRIELDQDIEGNVSELSSALEIKLKEIGKLSDKKTLKKVLEKINDSYKYLTFEEIEELLEEASLLKEVEKLGDLNPIPQAVFAQVESDLEKKRITIPEIGEDSDISGESNAVYTSEEIDGDQSSQDEA